MYPSEKRVVNEGSGCIPLKPHVSRPREQLESDVGWHETQPLIEAVRVRTPHVGGQLHPVAAEALGPGRMAARNKVVPTPLPR